MRELYMFLLDIDRARVIAMVISCVASLGVLSFIWSTANQANLRVTTAQWVQIYLFGFIAFISGVLVLGFIIVPKNADKLLEMTYLRYPVDAFSRQVQAALLYIVRLGL